MRQTGILLSIILLSGALSTGYSSYAQTSSQSETLENFGQEVSDFIHEVIPLFKKQRAETLDTIKECRKMVNSVSENERSQKRTECRENLDSIKEKYKEKRILFRDIFKEFGDAIKPLIRNAKDLQVKDTERMEAIKEIRENAMQKQEEKTQMAKEERKSIKALRDLLKKETQQIRADQKQLELKLKNQIKEFKNKIRELSKEIQEKEFEAQQLKHAEERAKQLAKSQGKTYLPPLVTSEQLEPQIQQIKAKTAKLQQLIDVLTKQLDELQTLPQATQNKVIQDTSDQIKSVTEEVQEISNTIEQIDSDIDQTQQSLEEQGVTVEEIEDMEEIDEDSESENTTNSTN